MPKQIRGPPELFEESAAAADGSSGSSFVIPRLKSVVVKVQDIAKVTKKDSKAKAPKIVSQYL